MATCDACGKSFSLFEGTKGRCHACRSRGLTPANYAEKIAAEAQAEEHAANLAKAAIIQATEAAAENSERMNSIMLTTENSPGGLVISARLGIITAECVLGMHLFKDVLALGRDMFGGRSSTLQQTLKEAKTTALAELRAEAFALGADAVVAIDLDYSEISGGGKSMLFLVASGTAVKLTTPIQPADTNSTPQG